MWLGYFLRFGPDGNFFGNSFTWLAVPACGSFRILEGQAEGDMELWALTWVPQAIFGAAWAIRPRWFRRLGLVLVLSSLLAAVVGVLASCGGLALRKVANRIRADPEEPPSILRT